MRLLTLVLAVAAVPLPALAQMELRPPAAPLIAHDPYLSVWSFNERLAEGTTRHWTGREHALNSLVRIDGETFRLLGNSATGFPALPQTALRVYPTRTIAMYRNAAAEVRMTFTTPVLPDDVSVLSRPATYVTWDVRSLDGKTHAVEVEFDASSQLAVNEPTQPTVESRVKITGINALRSGTLEQPVLGKRGDDLRIDWGHLYVAAPTSARGTQAIATSASAHAAFGATGRVSSGPRGSSAMGKPALAFALPLGSVGDRMVSRHITVAYDDRESIQYFGQNLKPYWRRNGAGGLKDANALLLAAERDYVGLSKRCETFDREIEADLTQVGGAKYAWLGALAYRQSLAAQKVVADAKGQPLMFSKENNSNGCIATVDILYPASPALLLFNPSLMKASLVPIMDYSSSARWKWPFAPHDLGTYPLANGQVYGGGERTEQDQMPVEETGNMLIMLAALAQREGNAEFSARYWPVLEKWAAYLVEKGFDPESQLSTDDFAGYLAHNVNLSAKAIEALGAYAKLADMLGKKDEAVKARAKAQEFAARWIEESRDGDHTRLAFDKSGTWSQKYNLAWDRILGLNLFPTSVAKSEMAFYRKSLNRYGLPLDSRRDYTKLDWTVWTATLTGDRADFDALINPVVAFLNDTSDRVPMTDWYRTEVARQEGFKARSVVGGVFLPMLADPVMWAKWAGRDRLDPAGWASQPIPPVLTEVVATARTAPATWRWTTAAPAANWFGTGFNDSTWASGPSGFGTAGTPGATVRTPWTTSDIWIRRTIELPQGDLSNLQLFIHHDEDVEVYINGVLAAKRSSFVGDYEAVAILPAARRVMKSGPNVVAVHCHQTGGGQFIDVGFGTVSKAK